LFITALFTIAKPGNNPDVLQLMNESWNFVTYAQWSVT
jgi:hypothetical protein